MSADLNQKKDSAVSPDEHMGISFNETKMHEAHEMMGTKPSPDVHQYTDTQKSHLTDHHVFDVTRAFHDDHVEAGTIVSDKKRHRATLKENLFSAFGEMWGNAKGSVTTKVEGVAKIAERKKEEPVMIQKAETRAEVVKQAATHSAIAPKNDHKVAIPASRTFKQDVERLSGNPFTVKPEDHTAKTWTHIEGGEKPKVAEATPQRAALPDLRRSMVAPVVPTRIKTEIKDFALPKRVETRPANVPLVAPTRSPEANVPKFQVPATVEKKEIPLQKTAVQAAPLVKPEHTSSTPKPTFSFAPIPNVPQRAAEPTPVPPPKPKIVTPPPAPKVVAPPPPIPPIPNVPLMKKTVAPPPEFHMPTPAPQSEVAPLVRKEVPVRTQPPLMKYTPPTSAKPRAESHTIRTVLRWTILLGIVLLGVALAIALVLYLNARSSTDAPTRETITIPAFFETNAQVPVPFTGDKTTFLATLSSHVETASGAVHLYPTITDERGVRAMTTEELLIQLGAGMPEKTRRALEDNLMIGSIATSKNEPFMVIRSYNFDVLFSGMLAWEATLYQDFAPFFGSTYTGPMIFTDAIQNNKSIRILRDTNGNEVLLYSFINQNTVVLTTSTEALSQIISRF